MGIWNKIKLAGTAIAGLFALFFGIKYKNRGTKIENQEKEIKAQDEELKVQEVIHKNEISQKDLKVDLKEEDVKVEKKVQETKNTTHDKVYATPDEQEYEVKV